MDIKIRGRLSAYSRISSVEGLKTNIPDPTASDAGHVLGVGDTGKYTLFPSITTSDIDGLFLDEESDEIVKKDEIDSLFPEEGSDDVESITKDEIDSLFNDTTTSESVTKEEIDNLFEDAPGASSEETYGTVSFAEIDSLFD